eukprot:10322555-Ditylum_brightwellii.AAC.1
MQWQGLLTLLNEKWRARLDKDSDLPLDEVWKTNMWSEYYVKHEKCSSAEDNTTHVKHDFNTEHSNTFKDKVHDQQDNEEGLVNPNDNIEKDNVTEGDGIDHPEPTR